MSRYATIEDFETSGLASGALGSLGYGVRQNALDRASSFADSYLRSKYTLPIAPPYDPSLTDAVCQVAAWRLLCLRGFNPDNPGDAVIRQGYLDAKEWFLRIANGQAALLVQQSTPESLQPDVTSNSPRGYSRDAGESLGPHIGGGLGGWGQ